MITCKHQIALCSIHGCEKCEHVGDVESCPFAAHDDSSDLCPTMRDMIEIYESANTAQHVHKRQVILYVKSALNELGIPLDAKASMMTRTKFKTLIQLLTSPTRPPSKSHPSGGALSDDTVASHLGAFRSISSEALEDLYESRGFDLHTFSIPHFEIRRRKVQEISDRTIRKVEILMEKWLSTGKSSDRSAYILTFFALYCGMRVNDICNLKWNVFRQTPVGLMVVYTPHKSISHRRPDGKLLSFRIDNKVYCRIEPLIGNPDDYVIPRFDNRTGAKTKKNGLFCGKHVYLVKRVRKALKECGIGIEYRGQKSIHALRKYFETDRSLVTNKREAANACGHTERVQGEYYLGTLVGKVS